MTLRMAVAIGVAFVALPAGFLIGRRAGDTRPPPNEITELRAQCADAQAEAWRLRCEVARARRDVRREAGAKSARDSASSSAGSEPAAPEPEFDFATFQDAMRRKDWDAAYPGITRDVIEALLAKNGRKQELLVAAAAMFGEDEAALDFALEALQMDPDCPAALLAGIHRLILLGDPDEALEWLDRLKEADPANSLPNYHAAWLKMQKGDIAGGLEELKEAETKTFISDYVFQGIPGLEAFYREAGCSDGVAKIASCVGLRLGHLVPLRNLAESTADQATEAFGRGEEQRALSLADHARKLGGRLAASSRLIVESLVGFAIETRALELEEQIYQGSGDLARLEEVRRKIAGNLAGAERMKRIGIASESSWGDLSESEAVAFFDRMIREGEAIAARDLPAVRKALEEADASTGK